jgi:hypothetical protein
MNRKQRGKEPETVLAKKIKFDNRQEIDRCASEKPMEDWKKDLQTSGARVKSKKW